MLSDQVVVITGGAGLIGQEFVKAVIENNGIAIIADINSEMALKVQKDLSTQLDSDQIDFIQLDITSAQSVNTGIDTLVSKYGKIDALVNNAYPRNKNYGNHFYDVSHHDFVENMGLNPVSYTHLTLPTTPYV